MPDTVGYTTPEEIEDLFRFLTTEVEGADTVTWSAHCHDDLGLAVANSLAAVRGGARQVECALNGIGERAGNCAMEEVVMALRTRRDFFGLDVNVRTEGLYGASKLLSAITGQMVPRNKAIVGKNAFAHESGIHQHGVLANRETYEIMRPEHVGVSTDNLVLGKHSGRAALKNRAEKLGFTLSDNQLKSVFVAFKELADAKKEVFDSDIEALVLGEAVGSRRPVGDRQPLRLRRIGRKPDAARDGHPHSRRRPHAGTRLRNGRPHERRLRRHQPDHRHADGTGALQRE